jgi:hypothetical protein
MDFSENYTVTSQHEIQQAHFIKKQIAIFTAYVSSKHFEQSYIVVSDETDHGKYAVWSFKKGIIQDLKVKRPEITQTFDYTDGCAQQFKNIYTLSSLLFARDDFGVTAEHHFLATSHGKGSHDGIGGTFKRQVKQKVLSGNCNVTTAIEFFHAADSISQNTKVLYVGKEQIDGNKPFLNKRWENVKQMKGSRSCHAFKPIENLKLEASVTSKGDDLRVYDIFKKNKK